MNAFDDVLDIPTFILAGDLSGRNTDMNMRLLTDDSPSLVPILLTAQIIFAGIAGNVQEPSEKSAFFGVVGTDVLPDFDENVLEKVFCGGFVGNDVTDNPKEYSSIVVV